MLAAKLKMHPGTSVEDAVASLNTLERQSKQRIPKLKWCFVEPDVRD